MKKTLLDILDEMTPSLQQAFLQLIADKKSDIQISLLTRAIANGDAETALRILGLGPEYFAPLDIVLREAQLAGAGFILEEIRRMTKGNAGGQIVARFNGRNPRAEAWLKEESSKLITRVSEDTRKAIRTVLELDMQAGRGPRATALDIVGRVNRGTGRREGGLIGLTDGDVKATRNALKQLRSGSPAQMKAFLKRKGVTQREARLVMSYARQGKPVPAAEARKLVGRYSDNLLKLRGETIARTELLKSLHAAQDEGLQQLVDAGHLQDSQITEEWDASEDGDTRDSHAAVNGTKVQRGEFFIVGGYAMAGPGDDRHGAPAEEIINCRCRKRIHINFLAALNR